MLNPNKSQISKSKLWIFSHYWGRFWPNSQFSAAKTNIFVTLPARAVISTTPLKWGWFFQVWCRKCTGFVGFFHAYRVNLTGVLGSTRWRWITSMVIRVSDRNVVTKIGPLSPKTGDRGPLLLGAGGVELCLLHARWVRASASRKPPCR